MRTSPDRMVRHDISDEEAEALSDSKPRFEREVLIAAGGLFFGALPAAANAVSRMSDGALSLTISDMATCAVAVVAVAVMGVMALAIRKRPKGADMLEKIRARTAHEVRPIPGGRA